MKKKLKVIVLENGNEKDTHLQLYSVYGNNHHFYICANTINEAFSKAAGSPDITPCNLYIIDETSKIKKNDILLHINAKNLKYEDAIFKADVDDGVNGTYMANKIIASTDLNINVPRVTSTFMYQYATTSMKEVYVKYAIQNKPVINRGGFVDTSEIQYYYKNTEVEDLLEKAFDGGFMASSDSYNADITLVSDKALRKTRKQIIDILLKRN